MNVRVSLLLALAIVPPMRAQTLGVRALRTEYLVNPVGIDERRPRLSWQIISDQRGTTQSAYEIQVSRDAPDFSAAHLVWNSRTQSDQSVFVEYAGQAVASRTRYYWRVRVTDARGRVSPWSEPAFWEMALLAPGDWSAEWIGPPAAGDSASAPAPLLRRSFRLTTPVRSARLYVTGLGLYEVQLNGQRVSDALFTPGWTSYNHRLQYQTYDVTSLLRAGDNAIGATLGDGWYRGFLGFNDQVNTYGKRVGLLAQLEVRYADGRVERIVSDTSWKSATGPIVRSDIYMGETYDARLERRGWSSAPYDDRSWHAVSRLDAPATTLIAPVSPPVRRLRELRPVSITRAPNGETLFDLGQNFTGWARLAARGAAGTVVTLRFAEVLDRAGNIYTANLRAATATDRYIMRGEGDERFEPHFTFHGFRYVAIAGLPGPTDSTTITGVVLSSDLEETGTLVTSDSLLNRLQRNIVWGQRSNFLDVPTDCPQRDERLGWTGDAQVFARTAAFNMNVDGFFAKWLGDVTADQDRSGAVPWVIPDVLHADSANASGTAGWSDAAVVIPWTMYASYGDRRLLERQFESMRAWVDFMRRRAGPDLIWRPGWQFGDWLALHSDDPSYPGATTSTEFIATAHLAHSADIVSRAAAVLGRTADAAKYAQLFHDVRDAFNREFVSSTGRVGENTQTAYVLALAFDLLPDSLIPIAATRLMQDVRGRGMHLTTGFLGTPNLLHALSQHGRIDVAYALLTQRTYPSWLYPVTRGATTMWERWDGIRPDSSFEDPGMNSFNHYAFGAVGDWMYRNIGGIDLDSVAPAYRRSVIAPKPGGGITSAHASLETYYGALTTSWTSDSTAFTLDVTIPANTSAEITLPEATLDRARESGSALAGDAGISSARQRGRDVVVGVGSGRYSFHVDRAAASATRIGGS